MKSTLTSLITLLFLFTSSAFAQQLSTIKGTVLTSDSKPAEFSAVTLKGIKTKQVDKNGNFLFEIFEGGTYTVIVNSLGLEPQSKTVLVRPGDTVTVDFTLSASAQTLNTSARKESPYVSRLPLSNLENPQVYNVVDKELIREQMALTVEESFRNVPGAAPSKTGAGMPSFFSRGFQTSENFRDGMATNLKTGVDLAIVDRVETLKGPSATLFGGVLTSFGGVVNYVTKKPYQTFGGEVSYMMGSYNLSRLTADINTPLNEDKTTLFRINVATQKDNSFQDQGYGTNYVVAPSFSFRANDRLDFLINADIQTNKGTVQPGWFIGGTGVTAKSFNDLNLSHKRSFNDNSLIGQQTSSNVFFQANYKLSDKWKSQTIYATGTGEYNNLYIYDLNLATDSTMQRLMRTFVPEKGGRQHAQQNFTGDFQIFGLRNRIVAGLDFMYTYRNMKYTGIYPDGTSATTININQPIPSTRIEKVNAMVSSLNTAVNMSHQYNYGAYVSNVLNLSDRLLVMASLRADRLINRGTKNSLTWAKTGAYTQTAFSPKFGLVYQVVENKVSLFGNYMNGFKNVPNTLQPNGSISVFKPQWANQWEAGAKLSVLRDKLSATLSYYDISVTNALRPEQNFTRQDGTQESKGVEIEIIGNPIPGLNFITGYGYNDNKYTKASTLSTNNIQGKRALGTPEHVGSIWTSYSLLNGAAKGLGIGAGLMYVSDAFQNNTNTFTLKAYTVVDGTIFYNTAKYRLSIKGNNLLNKEYWVSDGYYARPQKLANFQIGAAYKLKK